MSLSTTTSKIIYTGNGATTQWDIPFPFLRKEDIQVYRIDTNGEVTLLTSDYQINEATRVLTYPLQTNGVGPLDAGAKLLILRNTPRTQSIQLMAQETVDASVLESGYDKAMMICQELEEKLNRCVQLPQGSSQQITDMQSYITHLETLFAQATHSLAQAQEIEQNLGEVQSSIDLAHAWATKTDGPVSGTEYSAKQYALQAEEALVGKADTSLSNLTNSGQILTAHASMPSNTFTTLTVGTSGTSYTAPADGYFAFNTWTTATATSYFQLVNVTCDLGILLVPEQGAGYQQKAFVPVKKGDRVVVSYGNLDATKTTFKFIYAVGAISEAN